MISIVNLGIAAAWLGVGCFMFYRTSRGYPYVAVLPDGVLYSRMFSKPRWIPWADIANARGNKTWSLRFGWAQVELTCGRRITIYHPFLSLASSQDFASKVRARIESINAGEANALGTTKHTKVTK